MGIAAYNRGTRLIEQSVSSRLAAVENTIDAKALLWTELIEKGYILTFYHQPVNRFFTIGPYRTSTSSVVEYALIWHGPLATGHGGTPLEDFHSPRAWAVALAAIRFIGRKRPTAYSKP